MSDTPPFFALSGSTPAIGAGVLLVGRPTVPIYSEADSDPIAWFAEIEHPELITVNQPRTISVTLSGSFSTDKERIIITESGDAADCAKRVVETTGTHAETEFSVVDTLSTVAKRYAIADYKGHLPLGLTGSVSEPFQEDDVNVQDSSVATALCGSSGCLVGELPNFDNGSTETLTTGWGPGLVIERVARKAGEEIYLYQFQYQNIISVSGAGISEQMGVIIYTGTFSDERIDLTMWPFLPDSYPEGYTLSEEATAGTLLGAPLKARYLAFNHSHEDSSTSGTENLCPLPDYFSDVTTGSTSGTVTASVSEA